MSSRLRIASYNLRDLRDDRDAVVRVIRAIDPDVLCLQEVPRHPFSGHRVADLATRCGLTWAGGHRGSGGTTVLTALRLDVLAAGHERLPVPSRGRQRGYAGARVRLPGRPPLAVVSVHLGLDADERVRHAREVLDSDWLAEGPALLAGDLNEGPDGRAWQAIAQRMPVATSGAPTYPSSDPQHRIDAVFATADLQPVEGPPVVLDGRDVVAATDHRPVWVDLRAVG